MLELSIPGRKPCQLTTLICDVNGTLAVDGSLIDGVAVLMGEIKKSVDVYLLTADTMGFATEIARILDVKLQCLQPGNEKQQKVDFVNEHDGMRCIAIGQGANDEWMLREAALGICVISPEGTAINALNAADIVVPDILSALQLIQFPKRLIATLRQ